MLHDDAYVQALAEELVQDADADPRMNAALVVVDLAPVMPRLRQHMRFSRWFMSEWAPVPDRRKNRKGNGEAPDLCT